MPTRTLRTADGGSLALTWDRAAPDDGSPAGVVLALLVAQCEQDHEACLRAVTEASRAMVPPGTVPPAPFFGDTTIRIVDVTVAGAEATVQLAMSGAWSDGKEQPMTFVCEHESGGWRVGMLATMARLMAAADAGLGALGEGMAALDAASADLAELLKKMPPPEPPTSPR